MIEGIVELETGCYGALLQVKMLTESLSGSGSCYVCLSAYVNKGLGGLTGVLEDMKEYGSTSRMAEFAEAFRETFYVLHQIAVRLCQQTGQKIRYSFRKVGDILFCLFKRVSGRVRSATAALTVREADPTFRAELLDRIADALRLVFVWLRDVARLCKANERVPRGRILLGVHAARFVVQADTSSGVLVMRLDDGHQELFNLTPPIWEFLLPLLTTNDSLGHARLDKRPQGLLTRHDEQGDEIAGDLQRLKLYIHPVGKGRGGNGLYYLAPYPRQPNKVG